MTVREDNRDIIHRASSFLDQTGKIFASGWYKKEHIFGKDYNI